MSLVSVLDLDNTSLSIAICPEDRGNSPLNTGSRRNSNRDQHPTRYDQIVLLLYLSLRCQLGASPKECHQCVAAPSDWTGKQSKLLADLIDWLMVGRGGLEPPTSRLSGVRSNHLSYRPILVGPASGQLPLLVTFASRRHCQGFAPCCARRLVEPRRIELLTS